MYAHVQTIDIRGLWKMLKLGIYNPLNNIHDWFEFLNQWNDCIPW